MNVDELKPITTAQNARAQPCIGKGSLPV